MLLHTWTRKSQNDIKARVKAVSRPLRLVLEATHIDHCLTAHLPFASFRPQEGNYHPIACALPSQALCNHIIFLLLDKSVANMACQYRDNITTDIKLFASTAKQGFKAFPPPPT